MNYFKEAERILSSRSKLDKALQNLEARKNRLIQSGAPREINGMDYAKAYTKTNFVNDTLQDYLDLIEVEKEIKVTTQKVDEIDNIVGQLSKLNEKIITLWYIEKKSKEEIAKIIDVFSNTTAYNLRNKAVSEFTLLYFGAVAL